MSQLNPNAQPFVAASPRAAASSSSSTTQTSKLNRDAPPYVAVGRRVEEDVGRYGDDEDERCLFMTFSSGSPLTNQEIFNHFSRKFEGGVEGVYVHRRENRDPEFGKIIFTTPHLPRIILSNKNVVKIWVNKKPIWLKKYVPRSHRSSLIE